MANSIEETISVLYEMVQDARGMPLGNDKCILERDKILDLLDEISSMLPGELKQARTIVESRNEVITSAKREAEDIRRQAEARAKQMISRNEIVLQAQNQADEMIRQAEGRVAEIRRVSTQYVDDALKTTEDAIAEALNQVKATRGKFAEINRANALKKESSPIIRDV